MDLFDFILTEGLLPEQKDYKRIEDIVSKSNGDESKGAKLALTMSKRITDRDKLERRYNASKELLGDDSLVTKAFKDSLDAMAGLKQEDSNERYDLDDPLNTAEEAEVETIDCDRLFDTDTFLDYKNIKKTLREIDALNTISNKKLDTLWRLLEQYLDAFLVSKSIDKAWLKSFTNVSLFKPTDEVFKRFKLLDKSLDWAKTSDGVLKGNDAASKYYLTDKCLDILAFEFTLSDTSKQCKLYCFVDTVNWSVSWKSFFIESVAPPQKKSVFTRSNVFKEYLSILKERRGNDIVSVAIHTLPKFIRVGCPLPENFYGGEFSTYSERHHQPGQSRLNPNSKYFLSLSLKDILSFCPEVKDALFIVRSFLNYVKTEMPELEDDYIDYFSTNKLMFTKKFSNLINEATTMYVSEKLCSKYPNMKPFNDIVSKSFPGYIVFDVDINTGVKIAPLVYYTFRKTRYNESDAIYLAGKPFKQACATLVSYFKKSIGNAAFKKGLCRVEDLEDSYIIRKAYNNKIYSNELNKDGQCVFISWDIID